MLGHVHDHDEPGRPGLGQPLRNRLTRVGVGARVHIAADHRDLTLQIAAHQVGRTTQADVGQLGLDALLGRRQATADRQRLLKSKVSASLAVRRVGEQRQLVGAQSPLGPDVEGVDAHLLEAERAELLGHVLCRHALVTATGHPTPDPELAPALLGDLDHLFDVGQQLLGLQILVRVLLLGQAEGQRSPAQIECQAFHARVPDTAALGRQFEPEPRSIGGRRCGEHDQGEADQ